MSKTCLFAQEKMEYTIFYCSIVNNNDESVFLRVSKVQLRPLSLRAIVIMGEPGRETQEEPPAIDKASAPYPLCNSGKLKLEKFQATERFEHRPQPDGERLTKWTTVVPDFRHIINDYIVPSCDWTLLNRLSCIGITQILIHEWYLNRAWVKTRNSLFRRTCSRIFRFVTLSFFSSFFIILFLMSIYSRFVVYEVKLVVNRM